MNRIPSVHVPAPQINWDGLNRRYMNPGELETLVGLFASVNPRSVLEIGVNEGRTAKALLQNIPTIQEYVGVDVPRSYKPARHVQRNEVPERPGHMAASDPRFRLMLRDLGSLELRAAEFPQGFDAIFIDGDHGWRGVVNDSMLAGLLIRPGGIIAWHDYHERGTVDVRDVLQILSSFTHGITHAAGTWIAFKRMPNDG